MSKSVNLGDTRILDERDPELSARLLREIDLDDDRFRSPEFRRAMNDTRRGCFDALEDFLPPEQGEAYESSAPRKGDIIRIMLDGQWTEQRYVVLENCGLEDRRPVRDAHGNVIGADTIVQAELLDAEDKRMGKTVEVKTREGLLGSGDFPVQPVLVVDHMKN